MSKKFNSVNIISFPYEENCDIIQEYLSKCGLDCRTEKVYPPSGTVNSRHNWGCRIYYNKNGENDKIINNYLEENSYIKKIIRNLLE